MTGIVTAAEGQAWVAELPPRLHRQAALLRALIGAVGADARWEALELSCSVAEGRADELSDVDLGLWHGDDGRPDDRAVDALVRGLGDVVEVSARPWEGMPRWWVQYADGAQLDLVVCPAAARPGRAPGGVVLLDRTGRLADEFTPTVLRSDRSEQRGWLLDGWEALAGVAKYLERGSLLEAAQQVTRARDRLFQLQAALDDVAYPVFGLTSILDAGGELPVAVEETYPAVEPGSLLRAALALGDRLTRTALAVEPSITTPLAEFVTGRLVGLGTGSGTAPGSGWFAVRCVLVHGEADEDGRTYEERITLWRAPSAEVAFERAEVEAAEYAAALPGVAVLDLAQSYDLVDVPRDGAEVFSLMRDSHLAPDDYLTSHFDTGAERQTHLTTD